jgi:tyrosinase
VRDPLFFMLHANVDRLWAKWQWLYGRDDPTDLASYEPQGAYAAPCPPSMSPRLGHYVDDRMWPWDGTTGFVTAGDPCTERPATAPGGPIPAAIGGWGPPAVPRPRDVIDYDRWTLLGSSGLGYGYDDVPFSFTP